MCSHSLHLTERQSFEGLYVGFLTIQCFQEGGWDMWGGFMAQNLANLDSFKTGDFVSLNKSGSGFRSIHWWFLFSF